MKLPDGDAVADHASVAKLLDSLAFSPVGDVLAFDELRALNLAPADFGLSPPVVSIGMSVSGKTKKTGVSLGLASPSGAEVYAMSQGMMSVFSVPASVMAAVPSSPDGFRPLRLLQFEPSLATAVDVRVPDSAFVKLISCMTTFRP